MYWTKCKFNQPWCGQSTHLCPSFSNALDGCRSDPRQLDRQRSWKTSSATVSMSFYLKLWSMSTPFLMNWHILLTTNVARIGGHTMVFFFQTRQYRAIHKPQSLDKIRVICCLTDPTCSWRLIRKCIAGSTNFTDKQFFLPDIANQSTSIEERC
jgi:hypothetical protein